MELDNRHRGFLLMAAAYNVVWGVFIYNFQSSYIKWLSAGELPDSPWLWAQALGVLLVGLFFFLGAMAPEKFRWLILFSFFAKLFGGLFVYQVLLNSLWTKKFIFHLLINDLIWLLPLGFIIFRLFRPFKR